MDFFQSIISQILGMGLSDLLLVFVFLTILKLEIKIVLKIIGALILLELGFMLYSALSGGDVGQAQTFLCLVGKEL